MHWPTHQTRSVKSCARIVERSLDCNLMPCGVERRASNLCLDSKPFLQAARVSRHWNWARSITKSTYGILRSFAFISLLTLSSCTTLHHFSYNQPFLAKSKIFPEYQLTLLRLRIDLPRPTSKPAVGPLKDLLRYSTTIKPSLHPFKSSSSHLTTFHNPWSLREQWSFLSSLLPQENDYSLSDTWRYYLCQAQ